MNRIRWVVRTFPFTLFGIVSYVVLLLAARGVVSTFGPLRPVLAPAYASALPMMFLGAQLFPGGPVPPWFLALAAAFRLGLFLSADALLARWRHTPQRDPR